MKNALKMKMNCDRNMTSQRSRVESEVSTSNAIAPEPTSHF